MANIPSFDDLKHVGCPVGEGGDGWQGPRASVAGLSSTDGAAPVACQPLLARGASAPPSSNTGVLHTERSNEVLIDWLSMTFPPVMALEEVLPHLEGVDASEWAPMDRGAMGYKQGLSRGHVKVFHDGREDMGVHVALSGQGCRQFEADKLFFTEEHWRGWLASMLALGVTFTRFDTALDDMDSQFPALTMERVRGAISNQEVVSLFRKPAQITQSVDLKTGANSGDVVHFGSIMSEISVCIYDKAKEQLLPDACHWVRCEMRAKKDRAQALVAAFVEEGTAAVVSVLYGYLDFKEQGEDSNRWRWRTASWWAVFLEGCSKARLTVRGVKRTLDRVKGWLLKQVAPSLALVVLAGGGAIDDLLSLVKEGRNRLTASHKAMLAAEGMAVFLQTKGRLAV